MRLVALQFPVSMDALANVGVLASLVRGLPPEALVVAPEGSLSGYLPEPRFVERLDGRATAAAIEVARTLAAEAHLHLIAGACVQEGGNWRNTSYYMGPNRAVWRYDKINLAQSERGTFTAGDALPVNDVVVDGKMVRLGVQMCREIRYPEQWRVLAMEGARIVAYVNNAAGGNRGAALWRAHAISRAAEIQRFVVGANTASMDQICPSLIVAPSGQVIAEAPIGATRAIEAEVDLAETSDWVISQARTDVVAMHYRGTIAR